MATITKTTEWEGEFIRLVQLHGLPTRDGGYKQRKGDGEITRVVVHQSAGNFKRGIDAALAIARFHTADPKYKVGPDGNVVKRNGKFVRLGGGRGWPGIGYTFVIPGEPEVVDGKLEVYRVNPDDRHTYHTGATSNRYGVAVCFGGTFASRHLRDGSLTRAKPEPAACVAGHELILSYLLPRYGLEPAFGLMGHFDVGKPACPGDWLEQWVRHHRGEPVPDPMRSPPAPAPDLDGARFHSIEGRQRALVELGFDLGDYGPNGDGVDGQWGEASKGALLAFQEAAGLEDDGRWGPKTEAAVRAAMERQARAMDPFT